MKTLIKIAKEKEVQKEYPFPGSQHMSEGKPPNAFPNAHKSSTPKNPERPKFKKVKAPPKPPKPSTVSNE